MKNRILELATTVRRLSPAEAEVWIEARPEVRTPSTELRGRLTGPRCPGVTTIELGYPLRPAPSAAASVADTLTTRVLIPEPNLWTEATPFVYEGLVELWQDGECCDAARMTVGLKLAKGGVVMP